MIRRGILLAGGTGSRLYPGTQAVNKQLLIVYDKPMIYYPLSILMLAGIQEILIVSRAQDVPRFEDLFGDGDRLGMRIRYAVQERPGGIAEALLIGADFLRGASSALVLGDNVFHGMGLTPLLRRAAEREGATIFSYPVTDPENYGIVQTDASGRPIALFEKPSSRRFRDAVPGLYFYDETAIEIARSLRPSERGELEVTDVNRAYLERGKLHVQPLGRGTAWLDTGTYDGLLDAANYVATIERRQGMKIACVEEIAWRNGWIGAGALGLRANQMPACGYRDYLLSLIEHDM
jgi:glucose-1-phosphate thymidylyltransferase